MYLFKAELKKELLKNKTTREVADKIGITESYLSTIFNRRKECSKLVAFCIVKYLDNEKEILDYFDRV